MKRIIDSLVPKDSLQLLLKRSGSDKAEAGIFKDENGEVRSPNLPGKGDETTPRKR